VIFEVELWAFHRPERDGPEVRIRGVTVPDAELSGVSVDAALERVFHYGQNDFQPLPLPSVSVGDVVRYAGSARYIVMPVGFAEIAPGDPVGSSAAYDRVLRRDRGDA
jgi:hypothetical protein